MIRCSFKLILSKLSLFLIGFFASNTLKGITVEAFFEPASITLSNNCVYKVVIKGTQSSPQGKLPSFSGIKISNNPQTFRKVSLINGVAAVTLELTFSAKPEKLGVFQFPSWNLSIDGQNFAVPTASLEVLAPNQQDLLRQQKQRQKEEDLKKAAFIEFSLPRKYLFQGETVVSKISLLLWDKMPFTSIENAPVKIGDAFSLTELGQPIENRNIRRFNKSYTSYTWSVGLTAAITGEQTLSYYSNVRIRTQNRNPSPFNSPFFNDPFFGFGREENLKVSSPVNTIEIRPLPIRDRPKSFSGAIGNFFINSSIDSSRVSVGDPVRLTFTIKGNGNFSAMPAPIFEPSSKFKVGPPAFSFSGNKQTKFEGTQNFEYVITPLAAGLIKIPSPTFTFFDPTQETYRTSKSIIHSISVEPGEEWIDLEETTSAREKDDGQSSSSDLFQTHSEPGDWHPNFHQKKISDSIIFWGGQTIPLFAFCTLILIGYRKRNHGFVSYKQRETTLLKDLKKYSDCNDKQSFFRSYRSLIQFKIASFKKISNSQSLSSKELVEIVDKAKGNPKLTSKVEKLLSRIDGAEFDGSRESDFDLREELKQSLIIIKELR